jgi:predicted nucleotidyltransferase
VGNTRLLRAAKGTPLTRPLTDLLAVTYGPLPVLTDALRSVPGTQRAYIYGSWAARYRGEVGPVPVDVDVLVVGTADLDDLEEAARRCEPALGREVNIRRISPDVWDGEGTVDPFLASVKSKPLVELDLGHHPAVRA